MNNSEVFAYTGGPAPAWLDRNAWYVPVQVPKEHADKMPKIALQKVELKVVMCCLKCEEIVVEEIREVAGVFDVKIDSDNSKVTVIGRPDALRVLKKARKVDRNAQFWVDPEPPKEAEKPKEEGAKEEKKDEGKAEGEKKDEKAEGEKKEGDAKDDKGKDEKKEEGKGDGEKKEGGEKKGEKPKEETAATASAVQYTPFEYATYQYRPSQSYHPLYPDYYFQQHFTPQVLYTNPNYLKHVKIAY